MNRTKLILNDNQEVWDQKLKRNFFPLKCTNGDGDPFELAFTSKLVDCC